MHAELELGLPAIIGFLLVLARVGGVVAFLPLPGLRNAPEMARVILALGLTFALFPAWPAVAAAPRIGQFVLWIFAEAGFGLTVGLATSFLLEGFQLAAQIFGLQAGYSYASTIDPNSQADAGVLGVITMLASGMLFFTLGLDREVIRILAASFAKFPAGTYTLSLSTAEAVLRLGAGVFTVGMRLAMPVVALLLLIDVALALLGRMQQQLQLLPLAFPLKMLAALALLAAMAPLAAKVFEGAAQRTLAALWRGL